MKKSGFTLAKARSRWYALETITDAGYGDDIALQANIPAQAESMLDSLERAASCIGLRINTDKTEFMYFN